jgi:predicted CXXCH cytochrome family protein
MRLALPAAFLCALLACLMTFGLTLGEQGKAINSEHDLGVAAYPGVSACETCHFPHDAGGESLWAQSPYAEGEPYSGIMPLCYSCHDGTVTAGGGYVFDPGLAQHPSTPGKASEDCDMCHDPHTPDYSNFLLFPAGANLCRACHARSYDRFHSLNVDAIDIGYAPEDAKWSPNDGDFSGTRLWDAGGSQAGSYLKCLSCHAAHGAVSTTTLLTMRYRDDISAVSPLCLNCHR